MNAKPAMDRICKELKENRNKKTIGMRQMSFLGHIMRKGLEKLTLQKIYWRQEKGGKNSK